MEAFLDFIKILLPASLVLYAVYLMVRSFIRREIQLKTLEIRTRSIETILPSRLQAYERMTLFLERISLQNSLIRHNAPGLTAKDLQRLLLEEIRNEYNHNASQQIFMSEETWSHIISAKEDLVVLINDCANRMKAESTGMDLAKALIESSMEKKVDMNAQAMHQLKEEIQQLF